MLLLRVTLCLMLILLLLNSYCECQQEIRNAIKTKTNRKINKGKQGVQHVKDKTRGTIDRADAKINQKNQNAKRKINAINQIIKS
jgi:hypothetical protein